MHMSEENWKDAQSDFFESFRNYDEAGSLQRITVLKYLVLTTMLMKSDINPFESQETKPYKGDARISAMTDLVDAYQQDDIHRYESVLASNKDLLDDAFIAENIDEVTRNMRTKAVQKLIAPYTRFRLDFVGKALKIPIPEVQDILGFLIVDKKVNGKINQQDGTMEIEDEADKERLSAMQAWSSAVTSLYQTVFADGEGYKITEVQPQDDFPASIPSNSMDIASVASAAAASFARGGQRGQGQFPGQKHKGKKGHGVGM